MPTLPFLRAQGWTSQVEFFATGQHRPLLERVAGLRRSGRVIYPAQEDLLRAFACTAWNDVRVLILGQDPYHGKGQAHGLAFSVPAGTPPPPSLRNICKEVARDTGAPFPPSSDLSRWAEQGVLLLNTVLSVEDGKAHSHAKLGWQELTRAVLTALAARPEPLAALLWGNAAKEFLPLFTAARSGNPHLVLCAAHPSPLSACRGFHGCGHFSAVNAWLRASGRAEIVW
ncbi:MAG: uracil-DNA glycosylase [Desulfovibrionaceae bacterium]